MIGLAFEKHDTHMLKQKIAQSAHDDDSKLKLEYRRIDPSFVDIVLYTYCYVGLLTGQLLVLFFFLQ